MKTARSVISRDPFIEAYKRSIDTRPLRENLRISVEERFRRATRRAAERGNGAAARTDYRTLFELLARGGVEYILVGGAASIAHGAHRVTEDFDILYRRTPENLERTARAVAPLDPYLRDAPPGLPFTVDRETLERGVDFVLTTRLGNFDLLGELTGGGGYEELVGRSLEMEAFSTRFLCLGIESLIQVKRAAGRWRDFEAVAELELILQEGAAAA